MDDFMNFCKGICKFFGSLYEKFISFWKGHPVKTLSVVSSNRDLECWWHLGEMEHKKAMQIVGKFLITN